jgi:hypothetical protein
MSSLRDVILTLQYCLETFEATCQCGRCDPCTKGRDDIRSAISALEELEWRAAPANVQCEHRPAYVLTRDSARAEFADRGALVRFVRDCLAPSSTLGHNATLSEIAALAARNEWTLIELQSDSLTSSARTAAL